MKDAKGHGSSSRGTHSTGVEKATRTIAVSKKAVDVIRQNASTGFSVKPSGEQPKGGFQVAMQGRMDSKPLDMNNLEAHVAAHVAANRDVYGSPNTYIGGWNNPKTGQVHLEPSRNYANKGVAVQLGKARNQVSIWHHDAGEEIHTGGTGE
jgi:hypothetical protein